MTQVASWSGTAGAGVVSAIPGNTWDETLEALERRTANPPRTVEVTEVLVARAYAYFVREVGNDVKSELNKLTVEELVQFFLDC